MSPTNMLPRNVARVPAYARHLTAADGRTGHAHETLEAAADDSSLAVHPTRQEFAGGEQQLAGVGSSW